MKLKIGIYLTFLFIVSTYSSIVNASNKSTTCTIKDCFLIYDSFDLDRMVGLSESSFGNNAKIKYYFDENDLKNIIEKKLPNNGKHYCYDKKYCNVTTMSCDIAYCDGDIRSKIIIRDKIFFINREGYMRENGNFYKINKQYLKDIVYKRNDIKI